MYGYFWIQNAAVELLQSERGLSRNGGPWIFVVDFHDWWFVFSEEEDAGVFDVVERGRERKLGITRSLVVLQSRPQATDSAEARFPKS